MKQLPRKLSEFTGQNAVIGCSHNSSCSFHHHLHRPPKDFYTIDYERDKSPDHTMDIRNDLPAEFRQRFDRVILECVDLIAYNNPIAGEQLGYKHHYGADGFANAFDMVTDNGFLIIIGCPRCKPFRNSVKNLRYFEFSSDPYFESDDCLIIPKNQNADMVEMRNRCLQDPQIAKMLAYFQKRSGMPINVELCDMPFDHMSRTIRDQLIHDRVILTQTQRMAIQAVRNQHQAIDTFYKAINHLKEYNDKLNAKDPATKPLKMLCKRLTRGANLFFSKDPEHISAHIQSFQRRMTHAIKVDQAALPPCMTLKGILLNILVALTGLGAIAIGCKMIHSKLYRTGKFIPFFAVNTKPHEEVFKVHKAVRKLAGVRPRSSRV